MIVADKNTLRRDYRLALVKDVFKGEDGKVHKVTVHYKSYCIGESVHEYRDARETVVSRAVQLLGLLVPLDSRNTNKSKENDDKHLSGDT